MSDIGAKVAELIAAGCSPEVAARVVAETFVAGHQSSALRGNSTGIPVDEVAEKRRAYDRARKRKSTGIPPDSTGTPRNSENASLSKEEKKEDKISEREATKRNVRGHRLPDDWAPSLPDTAIADEMLGGPERRRAELEKFRDHWKQQPGSKGVKLDWNAAWRNWIRRAAEYRGGSNGQRAHNANGRPAGGSFFDGLRSLAEDISGDGAPPRPAGEEIPRGRIEIDG